MEQMPLNQACELCEWLVHKGVGMGECAHIITDMELGDSFGLALLKVYKRREVSIEKLENTWDDPVIA